HDAHVVTSRSPPVSARVVGRLPAHAAAPPSATSRPYTRSSPRSIRSPPIAILARPAAPTPAAPPAPAPPVRTRSVVPWLHPLKSWSLRQSRGGSPLTLGAALGQCATRREFATAT